MKFLIVGLGNIGAEYAHTRHNIGFDVVEALAAKHGVGFRTDRLAAVAEFKLKGKQVILIEPSTYMNLSGKAIRYWLQKEKISHENSLTICDDLNLVFGKLRLRAKGSDGGHNGLSNIQELLGTDVYPRLRVGIGSNFSKGKQVNFVLGKWTEDENAELAHILERSAETIKAFVTLGLDRAMNIAAK